MKRLKIGLLSASTLLLLAACGGTPDESDSANVPVETETEEPDPASSTDETTESETTDTTEEDTTTTEVTRPSAGNGIENMEFEIALDDAVQIFNEIFPEAVGIDQVKFEFDNGRFEYEMDGFNNDSDFELTIDASMGEILQQETDRDDDDDETAIDFGAIISPNEAMTIALDAVGSGYVDEWELDTDDGRVKYKIDIEGTNTDDDDVEIDAVSGDVIEID